MRPAPPTWLHPRYVPSSTTLALGGAVASVLCVAVCACEPTVVPGTGMPDPRGGAGDPTVDDSRGDGDGAGTGAGNGSPATDAPGSDLGAVDLGAADDGSAWDIADLRDTLRDHASGDPDRYDADLGVYDGGVEPGEGVLQVFVISDLNGSYGSTAYRDEVHEAIATIVMEQPDLVISTGDMVAGQRSGLDYRGMWRAFHAAVSDPLAEAGIPFAVTPGNHDASGYPVYGTERAIYQEQWLERPPELDWVDATGFPFRYSFRMGPAFFVSIDSTNVGPLDGDQMAWLDRQLARGSSAPVTVVFGHVPLVPFAQGRQDEIIGDPALEAMLVRHGVDLFLSGHHHAYYPGRRGPVRMVGTSCLGEGPRRLLGSSETSPRSVIELHLSTEGIESIEAYTGALLDHRILRSSLPDSVGIDDWVTWRDDLVADW